MSKWNFPFLLKWCSWMTAFRNFKTYLPSAFKQLSGCHFKILWKKRNIIVTFQSVLLTEQPKTLDHLGRFDLKFVRNCPTARGKIFGIKYPWQKQYKYMATGNYSLIYSRHVFVYQVYFILYFSTILIFDSGTVPEVRYFLFFILLHCITDNSL